MLKHPLLMQSPMLATPGKQPAQLVQALTAGGRHVFGLKADGVRALVHITDGRAEIRNRRLSAITFRYPDVVSAVQRTFPRGTVVLDGEIVVCDSNGRPSFDLIAKRDAQANARKITHLARSHPATFMAFDLLYRDRDLRALPLTTRLDELSQVTDAFTSPHLTLIPTSTDGDLLWQFVASHDLEGLVAKEADSTYVGRRDKSWVKLKRTTRLTAIATGYEAGEGSRSGTVGALLLSLLDGSEQVPVGKVGSGLPLSTLDAMRDMLDAGQEFLVEVEVLEVTAAGALRQPVFKAVRSDLTRSDCTVAQLV